MRRPKEVEMMVERRLRVVIAEDHRIVVDVPEDLPAGPAELILMVERPAGSEAGEVAVSASAKARFESLADELAADPRSFQELSQDERRARLRRVVGIGRELFSPSEEIARRKEEEMALEERRFGR
jgi:septum formation topological specificity factor MinE